MITKEEKREVTTNLEGQQFTVASTSYTFKVLSDKLYSNKIRAIVRELATNAYDSHAEAGKLNIPFTVHLPNELEPTFYVEDYGTGMSEEKILELYSSYFASDKRETNQAVGTFGLGSKSPFAYKGSFTVVSRYEGEETVYSCYLDEHEIPCIAKIFSIETPHCNGVKVEIPVDQRDFQEFVSETKYVLRPFEMEVEVIGYDNFEVAEYPNVLMEGNDYKILTKDPNNRHNNLSLAVQGNIEYGIDLYKVFDYAVEWGDFHKKYNIDSSTASSIENFFKRNNFIINIPMGKVTFPPSREHLEYTPYTKKNLLHILYRVYNDVKKKVASEMEESYGNRYLLIQSLDRINKMFQGESFDIEKMEVGGQTIKDYLSLPTYYHHKEEFEVLDSETPDRWNDVHKAISVRYTAENLFRAFLTSYFDNNKEVKIIYHNEQENESKVRSGLYRLKQHIRKDHFRAVVIYNQNLLNELGITTYENISSFEYIKKPGRSRSNSSVDTSKIKMTEVRVGFRENGSLKVTMKDENSTVDDAIADTGIKCYLRPYYSKYMSAHYLTGNEIEMDFYELRSNIRKIVEAQNTYKDFQDGELIVRVYFLSKIDLNKKDVKEANIQSFHKFLYKEWQKMDKEIGFIEYLEKKMYNEKIRQVSKYQRQDNILEIVENTRLKEVEEEIKTVFENVQVLKNRVKYNLDVDINICEVRENASFFNLENIKQVLEEKDEKNVYEELENVYNRVVEEKYPMIGLLEWENTWSLHKEKEDWNKIDQYIELVNSSK